MKEKECSCPVFRALEKMGLRWNPEKEAKEQQWRAKKGKYYYYINVFMKVSMNKENFHSTDNMLWIHGNYFHTEEEAEKYAKKFRRILREALD